MIKQKLKRLLLVWTASLCSAFVMYGQEININAGFDTSKILIGDQINFSISVEQPSDLKLVLPSFKDTLVKNIEILSGPVIDTSVISEKTIKVTGRYLVTSFDSGLYRINPVYVEVQNNNGIKRFYSDYSVLEVTRVKMTPPDTLTKIFDIIGPYRAPITFGEIVPWILLALLCGVIIWLLIRFGRKIKSKKNLVKEEVILEPAHIIAFRELEQLKAEKLWQKGETKKYYTKLTEIIRKYLENRFSVYSLEMTTSETLEALVKKGFRKDESYNLLKSVLIGADLVKFAKYRPEASENEINFENSWNFVSATKIEPSVDNLESGTENTKELKP